MAMVVQMTYLRIEKDGKDILVTADRSGPEYMFGPALMAVLGSIPTVANDPRTLEAWRVFCRIVMAARETNPLWNNSAQLLVPSHMTMPLKTAERVHKNLERQLQFRMGAAAVTWPFLLEAERRHKGTRFAPQSVEVEDRAREVLEQELDRREVIEKHVGIKLTRRFPEDIDNFETRVVRNSLPVIHLAVACALVIQRSQDELQKIPPEARNSYPVDVNRPENGLAHQIGIGHILVSREIQDFLVGLAEKIESLLPAMSVLRPKYVVRFRFR
jgi:hypothetical protein